MMATIGDRLRSFWKNYIGFSIEEIKIGGKETELLIGDTANPEYKNQIGSKELDMVTCRKTAQQCPLFMKGARKKAADSIRAWHEIETYDKKTNPPELDLSIIRNFERRTQLRRKWYEAKVASFIYGDSYLLITYEHDEKTKLHDPPSEKAVPWNVNIINSENITDIDYYPNKKSYYQKLRIQHFHYENPNDMKDYWIHPDRVIHMVCDKLPHRKFGTSKINLLRNIVKSMINIDIACGDLLSWFSHAKLDVKQDGMQDPELQKWEKTCNKHPGAYIHDETAEIKSIQPEAIDPKPFYEYLILKVAATFVMPTHILTGIQVGRVTGAEVGTGDYIKDIKDDQDLQDTPLLNDLYSKLLKSKQRTWKYEIVWNPIYIDELAEAEIMLKRTQVADLAMNGSRGVGGFTSPKESREIFNRGQIVLSDNVPKDLKKPQQTSQPKPSESEDEDENDGETNTEKSKDLYEYQLDASDKAMIKKRKEQIEKERKLGKEILDEQDKDGANV